LLAERAEKQWFPEISYGALVFAMAESEMRKESGLSTMRHDSNRARLTMELATLACAWGVGMVESVLQLCHPDIAKVPPRHLVVGMFVISIVSIYGVVLSWRRWIDNVF